MPFPDGDDRPSAMVPLSRRDLLLVLAAGCFLTLAHGLSYITGNEHAYFLRGMRLADPSFIPRDWTTWGCSGSHSAFGYLYWLYLRMGCAPVATIATHWLTMMAVSFGVLLLVRLCSKHVYVVFLSTMVWLGIAPPSEAGLGLLYLFQGYLQPSSIAGPLVVLGFALLLHRRFLSAGIALGVGGLFHANFLIVSAPIVFVQVLAGGTWRRPRNMLALGLPLLLFWSPNAVPIVRAAVGGTLQDPAAMDIMIHYRAPHHYLPSAWMMDRTIIWCLWVLVGGIALFALPRDVKSRELRWSFVASLLVIGIGVLLTTVVMIRSVSLALPWRIAPWPFLLALVALTDRWCTAWLRTSRWHWQDAGFVVATAAVGAAWATMYGLVSLGTASRLAWLVAIPLGVVAARLASRVLSLRLRGSYVAGLVLVALALVVSMRGLTKASNVFRPFSPERAQLIAWLAENTPSDAVLIADPTSEAFLRVRARRALIAEFQCASFVPGELREWRRRLCDLSGTSESDPSSALRPGYLRLDSERAVMLRRRYGAEYVLVSTKEHVGDLSGLRERFHSDTYRVLEIPAD